MFESLNDIPAPPWIFKIFQERHEVFNAGVFASLLDTSGHTLLTSWGIAGAPKAEQQMLSPPTGPAKKSS